MASAWLLGAILRMPGANVMFADMDEKRLTEELGEESEDSNIRYFAGDLREKLTIANLLSATLDAFDQVDILINGARQVIPSDPLDTEDDSVRSLLNQNLMPALRLSQLVAKRMIKQAGNDDETPAGSIINLSSIAARRTHPDLMAYSVSTAALDQMTRSLAVALAPNRIRVNSIALGSVMSASLQSTLKENRDFRNDIEKHTPLARIAAPTELTGNHPIPRLGCGRIYYRPNSDNRRRPNPAGPGRRTCSLRNMFDIEKATASAWFRQLRDDIVAAFEALEDSHDSGPFSDAKPGRFEVRETARQSDDGSDAGGGLMSVMRGGRVFEKGRRERFDRLWNAGRTGHSTRWQHARAFPA